MQDKPSFWKTKTGKGIKNFLRWFAPGLGVKRWIAVLLFGTTMISVGLAMFLLDIYRTAPDTWWLPLLDYASLRFLPRPTRVAVFAFLGLGLTGLGIWRMNWSLLMPFIRPGRPVVDALARYRRRDRPEIRTIFAAGL